MLKSFQVSQSLAYTVNLGKAVEFIGLDSMMDSLQWCGDEKYDSKFIQIDDKHLGVNIVILMMQQD